MIFIPGWMTRDSNWLTSSGIFYLLWASYGPPRPHPGTGRKGVLGRLKPQRFSVPQGTEEMLVLEAELCWHFPVSFGVCAQPAQSRERCGLSPQEWGALAEDGRHHVQIVLMARRQRRGSCPVHTRALIKWFSMSWVSKTPGPVVQSLPLCVKLFSSVPAFAFPCQHHPVDPCSIPSWHQSVPNRDYSLYWKQQSLSQVICTDCLVWHWPLWKQLCWALVKFQHFGVIL